MPAKRKITEAALARTRGAPIMRYMDNPAVIDALTKCLPRGHELDRLKAVAMMAIKTNEKLAACDPASLLNSLVEATCLGLEISSPLGHCWMVPFAGQAVLMIGYKGFVSLAARSNIDIHAGVVWDVDKFDCRMTNDDATRNAIWEHTPDMMRDRGELKAAYAEARLPSGFRVFRPLHKQEADKAQRISRSGAEEDGPWMQHPEAMWLKTAIRRLMAALPLDVATASAVRADDMAAEGIAPQRVVVQDVPPPEPTGDPLMDQARDIAHDLGLAKDEIEPPAPSRGLSDQEKAEVLESERQEAEAATARARELF